jgi:GT2 family glycosyltransferase
MLAVGIVSCGRGALTQRCLDSVRNVTQTGFHIFLVDNGSSDRDTLSRLDAWESDPDVTLVRLSENLGPAAARNVIVERAGGRYGAIAMLDNDIVVCEGWDRAALAALEAGFDAVQPKLLAPDGRTVDRGPTRARQPSWLLNPEYLHRGAQRDAADVNQRMALSVFGGTAIVRSEVYRKTGGYDPRIWVNEDHEFALRAVKNGCCICYEPRCEMIHDHVFDPQYDAVRTDLRRQLVSHLVIWDLHRKLSLSPYTLNFHLHLHLRQEPLFLPAAGRWSASGIARRVERRVRQRLFRLRYSDVWASVGEGELATEHLRAVLAGSAVGESRQCSLAGAGNTPAAATLSRQM